MNKSTLSFDELRDRLIAARRFHYENFSKWMTFFYVGVGALFVAYYTLESSEKIQNKGVLQFAMLLLGYLVSLIWYWSAKGYYYWNMNFISVVNYHELDLPKEERIHNVFYDKNLQNNYVSPVSGANISTSKLSILFACVVVLFWGFFLQYHWIKEFFQGNAPRFHFFFAGYLTFCTTYLLSLLVPSMHLHSTLDGFPQLNPNAKKIYPMTPTPFKIVLSFIIILAVTFIILFWRNNWDVQATYYRDNIGIELTAGIFAGLLAIIFGFKAGKKLQSDLHHYKFKDILRHLADMRVKNKLSDQSTREAVVAMVHPFQEELEDEPWLLRLKSKHKHDGLDCGVCGLSVKTDNKNRCEHCKLNCFAWIADS